jgi:hypothetical protein
VDSLEYRGNPEQKGSVLTIVLHSEFDDRPLAHAVFSTPVGGQSNELQGYLITDEKRIAVKLVKTRATIGALRIRGRALESDGSPAHAIEIEPIDHRNTPTVTSGWRNDGFFESKRLQPGRYRVGVDLGINRQPSEPYGRYYYPETRDATKATEIVVADNFVTPPIIFLLPETRPSVVLRGKVVDEEGKPAPRASVSFRPVGGYSNSQLYTNERGEFHETTYGSVAFLVQCETNDRKFECAPIRIAAEDFEKPILLVIRPVTSRPAK